MTPSLDMVLHRRRRKHCKYGHRKDGRCRKRPRKGRRR